METKRKIHAENHSSLAGSIGVLPVVGAVHFRALKSAIR